MLASPLMPAGFSEDATQYRPVENIDAFKNLFPPPIEFVEGSSSGSFVLDEGKYKPINSAPTAPRTEEAKPTTQPAPSTAKAPKLSHSTVAGKDLYSGNLNTTWPSRASIGAGLQNTGNTCFLNSALQCLLHTPPLLHILQSHSQTDSCRVAKNAFCMTCGLRQVMLETHERRRSYAPYPIVTKLQVIAKSMRRGRQEDAHEFLRYAIDALQKSCLAGHPAKIDPKLAETTWVHKIFGGRLRSRVTCLDCGYNSDTFDRILDLSIDIYGVNTLKEALRKFVAVDHLKGADKYKCEKCKKPVTADKQFTLHEAPLVLTIHLKRFSPMGRKIGHPVKYDERLSLQPIMSDGQYGPTYSLYGIISHAGGGPNSGHYYAHVKSADGHWYEMNDESVSRQFGSPTTMKNAYILFYIRDKGQALEAAVVSSGRTSLPAKTGVVASMKKRKIVDSDDDEPPSRPASKTPAPFIGPLLPSTVSSQTSTDAPEAKGDPQAVLLKKRIAAVSQSPSKALQSLAQYHDDDDDDDDIGEKVEVPNPGPDTDKPLPPTPTLPSPETPSATSAKAPSALSLSVPASSFYGSATPKPNGDASKKRKSFDSDDTDEASIKKWARTPISPGTDSSTPAKERQASSSRFSGGNPYNRLRGSNNLGARRESGPPLHRYGRKRRFIV